MLCTLFQVISGFYVMTGYARLKYVKGGYARLCQDRTCYVMLLLVRAR